MIIYIWLVRSPDISIIETVIIFIQVDHFFSVLATLQGPLWLLR